MRASDNVRIRRQFRSYEKPQDEICVGDRVYCAVLPPQGNSRKLQLTWSGPVIVTEIINNALVKVKEYEVRNPRTYVAHRSKVRVAKKFGEKDVDPLFKLPRIPVEAIKDLADNSMLKLLMNFILKPLKLITGGGTTAAASRRTPP